MRFDSVFLAMVSVLILFAPAVGDVVIFSNLASNGDVGGATLVNSPAAGWAQVAVKFSVPALPGGGTGKWELTSADLVVGIDGGGFPTLAVLEDDAGRPGSFIASTTFNGAPRTGYSGAALTNVSFGGPFTVLLTPEEDYWMGLSVSDAPIVGEEFTRLYWRTNKTGQTGDYASSFDGGNTWSGGSSNTPTLRVNALVPEPGTITLLAVALLVLTRRRTR